MRIKQKFETKVRDRHGANVGIVVVYPCDYFWVYWGRGGGFVGLQYV